MITPVRYFNISGYMHDPNFLGEPSDWIQNMWTKIVEVSTQLHMSSSSSDWKGFCGPADVCMTSEKHRSLIESLEYHNPTTHTLGNIRKLKLLFRKEFPDNIILIYNQKHPDLSGCLIIVDDKKNK